MKVGICVIVFRLLVVIIVFVEFDSLYHGLFLLLLYINATISRIKHKLAALTAVVVVASPPKHHRCRQLMLGFINFSRLIIIYNNYKFYFLVFLVWFFVSLYTCWCVCVYALFLSHIFVPRLLSPLVANARSLSRSLFYFYYFFHFSFLLLLPLK